MTAMSTDPERNEKLAYSGGILSCAECGGLLCVQQKGGIHATGDGEPPLVSAKIHEALQPGPYADVAEIRCSSCGETLFTRKKDDE